MSTTFYDAQHLAICTTAKVASSEVWAYTDANKSNVPSIFGPQRVVRNSIGGPGGGPRLLDAAQWRYLVLVRDPWHRLLSGFKEKLYHAADEAAFAHSFFDRSCPKQAETLEPGRSSSGDSRLYPCAYFDSAELRLLFAQHPLCQATKVMLHNTNLRAACGMVRAPELENPLTRFLRALMPSTVPGGLGGLDRIGDIHFEQQTDQCLYPFATHSHNGTQPDRVKFLDGVPSPTIVPIDQGIGLDVLSAEFGHAPGSPRSFSKMGSRENSGSHVQVSKGPAPMCFFVPGHMLRLLLQHYLIRDYNTLTTLNVSYQSFNMLHTSSKPGVVSVCIDNKTVATRR